MSGSLKDRIRVLHRLGACILGREADLSVQTSFDRLLSEAIRLAILDNCWFGARSARYALDTIARCMLQENLLKDWVEKYPSSLLNRENSTFCVGAILAGNIPLVGFYDVLCALMSGAKVLVKPSSKDKRLLSMLIDFSNNVLSDNVLDIEFVDRNALGVCDALLVSGGDESIEAIRATWPIIPMLLRKGRTSVAVLTGEESEEDLRRLSEDVFLYHGFGCRSVGKIYIPNKEYLNKISAVFCRASESPIFESDKAEYVAALRNLRARKVMLEDVFSDGGSVLFIPSHDLFSPIASVYYEVYTDREALRLALNNQKDFLQVVVCPSDFSTETDEWRSCQFGQAQHPTLNDPPDGLDPLDFLLRLAPSPKM